MLQAFAPTIRTQTHLGPRDYAKWVFLLKKLIPFFDLYFKYRFIYSINDRFLARTSADSYVVIQLRCTYFHRNEKNAFCSALNGVSIVFHLGALYYFLDNLRTVFPPLQLFRTFEGFLNVLKPFRNLE